MIGGNDFVRQWEDTREDVIEAVRATGESARYILGREVEQFEKALADYWGVPEATGVASGLDAIEISLRALGCRAGDKVLTTPVSAFATTLPVVKLGAIPVFVDIDEFGLIDLAAARAAMERDTAIRFFLPVHLYGHALDGRELRRIQDSGVTVIEDCAQSIGATFDGVPTGTVGHASATSFYPTKNLGAMGEGGAVLSHDPEVARMVRMLRDYGQSAKYQHDVIGYNSRLDEVQAAMMRRVGMSRLTEWTRRRRAIAARYLSEIRNAAVRMPGMPPKSNSCWHLFPVLVDDHRKNAFLEYLHEQGVSGGEHYPIAIPDQKALSNCRFEIGCGGIEQARAFCRSEVSLPVHPYLTDDEAGVVIEAVNGWPG